MTTIVEVSLHGSKYHNKDFNDFRSCPKFKAKRKKTLSKSEAEDQGYSRCDYCFDSSSDKHKKTSEEGDA